MPKSYRIRTQPGVDSSLKIQLEQDFDFLEILSLKINQSDIYTRLCSDYGVIVGRVLVNGGFGVPNAKVSVFIPISEEDQLNPIISELYPYTSLSDVNEDGYRYNLLPYRPSYQGHAATGTFPDREDVLVDSSLIEVYDKYYKFTVKTNESGDYMIFGVPTGTQTLVMDVDLSDIGCFSLFPQDLIRTGQATESQVNGSRFKSSSNLNELPQIITLNKIIDVNPLWGEPEICLLGITRVDFDLTSLANVSIEPTATFMGSLISSTEEDFLKSNCKPKKNTGNLCDLTTAGGKILAIRQTIDFDINGQPILEQYVLPGGENIIDEDGTWLIDVPMNLDYVTTDEFGNQIISNDPKVGIPTKGKYRFRIQYQNEDGLNNDILRADYLVPNVREYGWTSNGLFSSVNQTQQLKSYAFSLDWNDYSDPQTAIDCEDYFYEFVYNKVYTVANFIDRWKWGYNRSRHLGIKEITDRACTTTNNRFPVNDGVRNFDFLFFLFNLMVTIFSPIVIALIPLIHIVAFLFPILKWVLVFFIGGLLIYFSVYFGIGTGAAFPSIGLMALNALASLAFIAATIAYTTLIIKKWDAIKNAKFKGINLPMMSYPDCEACPCDSPDLTIDEIQGGNIFSSSQGSEVKIGNYTIYARGNGSFLADVNSISLWSSYLPPDIDEDDYIGNKQSKYLADQSGVRYAIAGWQESNSYYFGVPIARKYSPNDKYVLQQHVPYSQYLNLMNLRMRYFDSTAPNIIQTTINNATSVPSTPFTDNVMILLCDPGVVDQYTSGSIISFNDINSINDPNLTGATLVNEFGSNSITGTSSVGEFAKVVKYINNVGIETTATIYLTGDSSVSEYKFKTGLEYFQVITGMTASQVASLAPTYSSILRKYIIGTTQYLCYKPDNPNNIVYYNINPLIEIGNSWENLSVLILVRGVDVWTKKQEIKYDLSRLFGQSSFNNTVSVSGQFYLNIPIQKPTGAGIVNQKSPESHLQTSAPYASSSIYHPPYDFVVGSEYTAVTTNKLIFYSSLDVEHLSFLPDGSAGQTVGYYVGGDVNDSTSVVNAISVGLGGYQGNVEGGSLIGAVGNTCNDENNITTFAARVYSPTYYKTNNNPSFPTTLANGSFTHWSQPINNAKIVLRSDRLPTSDNLQNNYNNSFLLHQNDNFTAYLVNGSESTAIIDTSSQATDTSNNSLDAIGDNPSFTDSILNSFSCEGMVPLKCYQSTTDSNGDPTITILSPCSDNEDPERVSGGCYRLVQKPYIIGIVRDITNFLEWKTRFRFMFGACRGIFSHVFQNNWVNGTLYMFSFKKQTIFDIVGQPKKYKFCGTYDNLVRPGQGPIYYTENTTNSFFYRSAPFDGTNFVGQIPEQNGNPIDFGGVNTRNLFFPTTIMDLGPKNDFINQICSNSSFEGYVVDTIKSTSFNDTADIIQLAIVSRLMNSNFLGQLLNVGDASINQLFSRTEDRLDGDIVQLFSINSEYGVEPFSDDNYSDNDLYVSSGSDPLVGIFFSSNTENRRMISPGIKTYSSSPSLLYYYGYPKSQKVPMYKWKSDSTTTIFGSDTNDWYTTPPFYSQKYQDLNFSPVATPPPPGVAPYFNNTSSGQLGYIYNEDPFGNPISTWVSGQVNPYIVGAPFHFYFGLRKGKSALNRFIKLYL